MQPIIQNPFQTKTTATGLTGNGQTARTEGQHEPSAVGCWGDDKFKSGISGSLIQAPTLAPSSAPTQEVAVQQQAAGSTQQAHGPLTMLDEQAPSAMRMPGREAVSEGARKLSGFSRVAAFVGLALSGVGVVAGLAPTAAMAATPPATSVSQTMATRSQTPVVASSLQDVVNKFDATHQIYVKGTPMLNGVPFSAADMQHLQDVLKQHPSTYVVLIDNTSNFGSDDMTLSRGIGNSQAFQGVTNPESGERDGKLLMVYFHANDPQRPDLTRPMAYRAESLPTRLGVGKDNFAAEDGSPRELMQTFINAFKNEGKDFAGSLDAVMTRVDGTESAYVQKTVGGATQAVSSATTAFNGFTTELKSFQGKYGTGGQLGSPNVEGWQGQLTQAQSALHNHDFQNATAISTQLTQTISAQEQAMANYGQAPGIAEQVASTLKTVEGQLKGLGDNSQAQAARAALTNAQRQLEQYNTQYKAKDANFWGTLQSARTSANEAASDVKSSQDSTAAAHAAKMYGSAALMLAILALGVIGNRRAAAGRKKATAELDEAIKDIGERSKELLDLMNQSDFAQVSGYQGKTKELADQLMANVTDALTLVGGARKFIDEADKLVNHGGIKNFFLRGNYDQAIDMLTNPEHKLSFGFTDASRAVLEKDSKAASWRENLEKAGTTREFQKSMKEILLAMADNRDHATQILAEIEKKDSAINGYLDGIRKNGVDVQGHAQALKQEAADGLFAVPSVTDNLLPMVLGDKDGLLAKGNETKTHDPVRAFDEFAKPAERMANEAGQIVALGHEARTTLIPTVAKGDQALQPNGVKTQWAHDASKQLSDRLDKSANTALRTSVADEVKAVAQEITHLEGRIETAVSQDKERRELSPKLIADAENDVNTARAELTQKLQAVGAFKGGTADKVLREPKLDPTTRTTDAHSNLDAVKPSLDTGDVDTAGQHLNNIHDLTANAHEIVKQSRAAFDTYKPTLDERQKRTSSIDASIGSVYQPSLDRIKKTYQAEVLKLVAPDVKAGETLADNIDETRANLTSARTLTSGAQESFDKAFLLTSRDQLNNADGVLKTAQANLDAITNAEKLLAQKQQGVEGTLRQVDGNFATTRANANQSFVRPHARQLLQQAQSVLEQARTVVSGAAKNPYRAAEALGVAENQRSQVEAAIETDRRAYQAAQSAISSAEGSITAAQASIASAAMQSWSWSNGQGSAHESVGMGEMVGATATLASASSDLGQARGLLQGQDYEGASRMASQASSQANAATVEAAAAVSSAKSRFDSQVSRLQRLQEEEDERRRAEERRREEEAAAARRAAESSNNSSVSNDFTGGGGGSGSAVSNW